MKALRLTALLSLALSFAVSAPIALGDAPFGAPPDVAQTAVPYTPLQPAHWGSWFDPNSSGEGMVIEVIDQGPGKNLLLVAYGYFYFGADDTPVWAFANEEVQPALVTDSGPPFYRFTLYRTRPGGAPPDPGILELRPLPDGSIEALLGMQIGVGPVFPLVRAWDMVQLSRAYPNATLIGCNPGAFSPPPPQPAPCILH